MKCFLVYSQISFIRPHIYYAIPSILKHNLELLSDIVKFYKLRVSIIDYLKILSDSNELLKF